MNVPSRAPLVVALLVLLLSAGVYFMRSFFSLRRT